MDKEPISQRAENAQVMKRILQYIRPYTGLVWTILWARAR